MNPPKQDSAYVNLAAPYELATFRQFTDSSQDDDNARIVGSYQNSNGTDWTATSSYNMFVTQGGYLAQRAPFQQIASTLLSGCRIERLWYYQSAPTTTGVTYKYVLMSAYNHSTLLYEMYWWRRDQALSYTKFTNLRNVNDSTQPHWVEVSQGKAYVKGFPQSGADKYGTIIFDGSSGTPSYAIWGAAGPTTPVRMSGWTGKLDADVSATATSWTVSAVSAPPSTPFTIYTGYETITCTAKAGTGPYTLTVTRAASGTTAAAYGKGQRIVYRDWSTPDHAVDVTQGWKYTYCYVTTTGQVSNSVDIERNPDLQGSNTGPFKNLIPKMTITGTADTTNYPYINVYRTTDGGANFLFLERITNTGGSITYEDKSFGTGSSSSTKNDPVPDTSLDTARVAPTQYSNSPPPTVNPPLVVGTDTPSTVVSKIVWFQRRLWYAIGNKLYYSSDEEISEGNPEESFKAGIKGNVINCRSRICSIEATSQSLYVMTSSGEVYIIYGSSAETGFVAKQIATQLPMAGAYVAVSEASVSFLDRVAFVTNDGRVAVISGENVDIISDPIVAFPGFTKLYFYKDWLIGLMPCADVITHGIIHIYDWKRSLEERRDFWQMPWTCRLTAMLSAPDFFDNGSALIGSVYDGPSQKSGLVIYSTTASSLYDDVIQSGAYEAELYNVSARLQPFKLPIGNHANGHAQPGMTPAINGVRLDYQSNQSVRPTVDLFLDNSSTTATVTLSMTDEDRRQASTGYKTAHGALHQVTQDMAIRIGNDDMLPSTRCDFWRLVHIWYPEAGT